MSFLRQQLASLAIALLCVRETLVRDQLGERWRRILPQCKFGRQERLLSTEPASAVQLKLAAQAPTHCTKPNKRVRRSTLHFHENIGRLAMSSTSKWLVVGLLLQPNHECVPYPTEQDWVSFQRAPTQTSALTAQRHRTGPAPPTHRCQAAKAPQGPSSVHAPRAWGAPLETRGFGVGQTVCLSPAGAQTSERVGGREGPCSWIL